MKSDRQFEELCEKLDMRTRNLNQSWKEGKVLE